MLLLHAAGSCLIGREAVFKHCHGIIYLLDNLAEFECSDVGEREALTYILGSGAIEKGRAK